MSVKASISLTDAQDRYARQLVAEGRYPSLSAVLQHGLEMLRDDAEARAAETAALRALLEERRTGPTVSAEDGRARTSAMLAVKRKAHGLDG